MKIKISQIIKFIVYLTLLLDSSFLMLIYINNNQKIYGMVGLAFLNLALIVLNRGPRNRIKGSVGLMPTYTAAVTIMIILQGIHAVAVNHVPVAIFMRNAGYYLIFFLSFSLLFLFETDGGTDKFWKLMSEASIVWFLWLLVQHFIYSRNGAIISPYITGAGAETVRVRNDNIRIDMRVIAHLVILYHFNRFYSLRRNRKRFLNLGICILGCVTMVVVEQTRGYYFAVFLAMLSILLTGIKEKKKFVTSMIILLILGIFLFETQIVSSTLSIIFSPDTTNRLSTGYIRLEGMRVFWQQFLSNPLLGFGFQGTGDYVIVSGWSYYFNDDGIVGLIGQIGIWAIILYLIMLFRQLCILRHISKCIPLSYEFSLLSSLFVYFILTSLSLICFWNTTCLLCPIIWAIFEFEFAKYKRIVSGQLCEGR